MEIIEDLHVVILALSMMFDNMQNEFMRRLLLLVISLDVCKK